MYPLPIIRDQSQLFCARPAFQLLFAIDRIVDVLEIGRINELTVDLHDALTAHLGSFDYASLRS
jgi:hypothetical protein